MAVSWPVSYFGLVLSATGVNFLNFLYSSLIFIVSVRFFNFVYFYLIFFAFL